MKDNYTKDGQRYERKASPKQITVTTHHQGYVLKVGDTEYMYYNVPDLIKGLAIHAGLDQEGPLSSEELNQLVDGVIDGTALEKSLAEIAELKKVIMTLKKEIRKLKSNR